MLQHPVFKHHFQVEVVSPHLVCLVSDEACVPLEGRLFPLLAPFLDGLHTPRDIGDALALKQAQSPCTSHSTK